VQKCVPLTSMSLSIVFGIPATTTFRPLFLHSCSLKMHQISHQCFVMNFWVFPFRCLTWKNFWVKKQPQDNTWNFNLVVGSFMMISPCYGSTSKQIAKLLMKLGCKVSQATLIKIKPLNWKQKLESKPQHGGEKLHASWITFAPFWVPSPPIM